MQVSLTSDFAMETRQLLHTGTLFYSVDRYFGGIEGGWGEMRKRGRLSMMIPETAIPRLSILGFPGRLDSFPAVVRHHLARAAKRGVTPVPSQRYSQLLQKPPSEISYTDKQQFFLSKGHGVLTIAVITTISCGNEAHKLTTGCLRSCFLVFFHFPTAVVII